MLQNVVGSQVQLKKMTFLGRPQQGRNGSTFVGTKIWLTKQHDLQLVMPLRKDIEEATKGHIVESMSHADIEIRRRRVQLCRNLRSYGLWAKLDGLVISVRDPTYKSSWMVLDEEEALALLKQKEV
jgi:hypothetical protein